VSYKIYLTIRSNCNEAMAIPSECKMPDLSGIGSPLLGRLIVQLLVGERGLSPKAGRYRRNFIRLLDKAVREYNEARAAILADVTEAKRSAEEMTAFREGFGDVFAEGVKRASERIDKGAEDIVMSVKNMAISTRDGRASKAWALGYAVAARGADHCRSIMSAEGVIFGSAQGFDPAQGEVLEVPGTSVDPLTEEGKAWMVKWYEDLRAFQNCMETCVVTTTRYLKTLGLPGTLAKFYSVVTGRVLNAEDVMHIGERMVNLERAFNVREGLTRKDDTLPKRFLEEPLPDGPAKGQTVKLEPMLDEYYQLRGWEKDTGFPTRGKLDELDLKEVADELESMGRLG